MEKCEKCGKDMYDNIGYCVECTVIVASGKTVTISTTQKEIQNVGKVARVDKKISFINLIILIIKFAIMAILVAIILWFIGFV